MPPPPLSVGTPDESVRFGRERDARIRWLLDMHPVTAAMLVALQWFPSKGKALRRLNRLVQRGQVRLVGTVCRKDGRPEHVFARTRIKADSVLHELQLTELCLRLDAGRIVRGPMAVDRHLRPDAEVWINGCRYLLENDRGSMGYAQIEQRFRAYSGCADLVLWVCSSAERAEGLCQRAAGIRHTALFTTMAEALATPHGPIWRDYAGGTAALPREANGVTVRPLADTPRRPDPGAPGTPAVVPSRRPVVCRASRTTPSARSSRT